MLDFLRAWESLSDEDRSHALQGLILFGCFIFVFLPFIMMDYEVHGSEYCWLGITVNKPGPVTAW